MVWTHWTILVAKYEVRTSECFEWAVEAGWIFQYTPTPKIHSTKKANCAFVVEGAELSTIFENNKAILYIMGVEVAWGNFLTDFMGCSATKARGIYDGTARAA